MEQILIFPSFEEFIDKKKNSLSYDIQGIVPFQSLKENIASSYLSDYSIRQSIFADYTLHDDDCIDICQYLSITSLVVQIDISNIIQIASDINHILSISKKFKFFVVCNDVTVWFRFYQLVGANPSVVSIPILSDDPEECKTWFSTPINSVILSSYHFDPKTLDVVEKFKPVIGLLYQRGVSFVFMSKIENLDKILDQLYQNLSQSIQRDPSSFNVAPLSFIEPSQEIFYKALEKKIKDKKVLIIGDHIENYLISCKDLGATSAIVYQKNPILRERTRVIAQQIFGTESEDKLKEKITIVKDLDPQQIQCDIVLTDFFLDFSFYPEISHFFTKFSQDIVPCCMESIIMPVMTQIWHAIEDKNAFYSIHPSMIIGLSSPQQLFKFSPDTETSISKIVEFETMVSGVLNGFLVESKIFITKENEAFQKQYIFIPLSRNVPIKQNDKIVFRIDRVSHESKAYFQWCLTSPVFTPIQNPNGADFTYSVDL